MATQSPIPPEGENAACCQEHAQGHTRNRWIAGVALIAIGLLALAGQFVKSDLLGLLFLPALGVIFLVWGIGSRNAGLLIPGGILSGIGLGVFLEKYLTPSGNASGGVIVLCMALGFAIITPLAAIFAGKAHWWALIVGGVMAVIGGALLMGGTALEVLNWVGKGWPIILIAFGLYVIFRRRKPG